MLLLKTVFELRPRLFQVLLTRAKETKNILESFKTNDLPVIQNLVADLHAPIKTPELVTRLPSEVGYIV